MLLAIAQIKAGYPNTNARWQYEPGGIAVPSLVPLVSLFYFIFLQHAGGTLRSEFGFFGLCN